MIRAATLVAATLCLGVCAACTADRPPPAPQQAATTFDASVTQFRYLEGTRNLRAGLTNTGDRTVRVSQATIAWDGFAFPTVPIPDGVLGPGQSAAFTIAYGEPRCSGRPRDRPTLVAVVDGRSTRMRLRVEDPGLLDRLQAKACFAQRLDAAATVALRLRARPVHVGGEEYLPGRLVIRHRTGATEPIRLVDLGGSVLLDLVPRGGARALPADLTPDARVLVVPVLAGSAHRCDAHARSQSSQTFLLSAYLRLGREPTQRRILATRYADQVRLLAVIDRDCR